MKVKFLKEAGADEVDTYNNKDKEGERPWYILSMPLEELSNESIMCIILIKFNFIL